MRNLILSVCLIFAALAANAQGGADRQPLNPIQYFEERVLAPKGSPEYVAMTYIYISCVTGVLIATGDEEKVSDQMLHSCFTFAEQSLAPQE